MIWVATMGGKLDRLDPNRLGNDRVYALFDSRGAALLSSQYASGTGTHDGSKDLPQPVVIAIGMGRSGHSRLIPGFQNHLLPAVDWAENLESCGAQVGNHIISV